MVSGRQSRARPRKRVAALALVVAGLATAGAAVATPRARADTTLTVTIQRGAGTTLVAAVTNNGPDPVYAADNSGHVTGGFGLTLDTGSSASSTQVASTIVTPQGWECGAMYDVIYCSRPGVSFAPGETVRITFPMNNCYPSGHTFKFGFTTQQKPYINYPNSGSGTFQGGACTTTHIGSARLTVSDQLKRLAAQLRERVTQLDQAKEAVESALPQKAARLDRAGAALAALEGKAPALVAQIDQTKSFLKEIGNAERTLPASVRAEIQARDSLEEAILALQSRMLQATQAGNNALVQSLDRTVGRDAGQLDVLNRSLAGKEGAIDQLRERWLAKLRVLQGNLFAARLQQLQAEREQGLADADLQHALGERAALDDQLFAVAERLVRLDLLVNGVSVYGGFGESKLLYRASFAASALNLQQLDDDLARLKPALDDIEAKRKAAFATFKDAERASIAALAKVTSAILTTAAKKAAVDFVANGVDVIKAGSKGGLIGASAETLKKVAETLVKEYGVDYGPGRYGSKGATEFNSDFDAKLTNAFLEKAALKVGAERVVKQTVSKKGKDALNKTLGKLVFEKVYGTIPSLYEQAGAELVSRGTPSVAEIEQIQAAVDRRAGQFQSLAGQLKASRLEKFGDLSVTILTDVAKNSLKMHFDAQEQLAWIDYFEKEIVARTYFSLWQVTAGAYSQAYEAYNALLAEKGKTLDGYDPAGHARTTIDETFFANFRLSIQVDAASGPGAPAGGTKASLAVLLGGKEAIGGSGGVSTRFAIDPSGLTAGKAGLGLELRVG